MKIVNLEPIHDGYSGVCVSTQQKFVKFRITSTSQVATAIKMPGWLIGYDEFKDMWRRFNRSARFLAEPVEVADLSLDTLKQIERQIVADPSQPHR